MTVCTHEVALGDLIEESLDTTPLANELANVGQLGVWVTMIEVHRREVKLVTTVQARVVLQGAEKPLLRRVRGGSLHPSPLDLLGLALLVPVLVVLFLTRTAVRMEARAPLVECGIRLRVTLALRAHLHMVRNAQVESRTDGGSLRLASLADPTLRLVSVGGFEPPTSSSPTKRATRLRYTLMTHETKLQWA
jgi:hypothetical protein